MKLRRYVQTHKTNLSMQFLGNKSDMHVKNIFWINPLTPTAPKTARHDHHTIKKSFLSWLFIVCNGYGFKTSSSNLFNFSLLTISKKAMISAEIYSLKWKNWKKTVFSSFFDNEKRCFWTSDFLKKISFLSIKTAFIATFSPYPVPKESFWALFCFMDRLLASFLHRFWSHAFLRKFVPEVHSGKPL